MASFTLQRPFTITNVSSLRNPVPLFPFLLSLLTLVFVLCVLSLSSTLSPLSRSPSLPSSKSKMFTFNFTFHVPNPFSMSTLTSVASAATDAFGSVATDIREDPELLNYMVAGLGPGGVAGGFGYDSHRLVSSSTSHSPPTSKALKSPRNKRAFGQGLANPHTQHGRRCSQGHERGQGGSTSGFVDVAGPPPGSGTPLFPTRAYSQSSSELGVRGLGQGVRNQLYPLPESRKRGWVPALSEPSYASTNEDFTTGFFDAPKYCDVDQMGGVTSRPCFGPDGCGVSGMGSGVGDRGRWRDDGDEEESEDAMEAGESGFLCVSFSRRFSFASPLSLSPIPAPLTLCRCLCDPQFVFLWRCSCVT